MEEGTWRCSRWYIPPTLRMIPILRPVRVLQRTRRRWEWDIISRRSKLTNRNQLYKNLKNIKHIRERQATIRVRLRCNRSTSRNRQGSFVGKVNLEIKVYSDAISGNRSIWSHTMNNPKVQDLRGLCSTKWHWHSYRRSITGTSGGALENLPHLLKLLG